MLHDTNLDLESLSVEVEKLIRETANIELLPRFTVVSGSLKSDGSVITEADLAMQSQLQNKLSQLLPEAVFLAEEMPAEEQNRLLASDRPVWCLDPLDGTSNYAAGIPYFAVSLSLIYQQQVVLGQVYDPVRKELFAATLLSDAYLNNKKLVINTSVTELERAMAIIDFKRLDSTMAARLATEQPFASQRNFGASALDWCWLAIQRGHVYLHGKQNIWDYSAGHFIFEKAGGVSCTLDGESVFLNKLTPRSVVAASSPLLLQQWKDWLGVSD